MITATAQCWAVTGPTGAGKSRFCGLLVERGALLVEADHVGHVLLDRPPIRTALVAAFGAGILAPAGTVDRARLGAVVFGDPEARQRLDRIVHPALAAALCARIAAARRARSPLVILEAAVYFVLPGPPPVHWIVAVTAPPAVRLARLVAMGLDPAAADARIAAQAHLEETWDFADRFIANDGRETTLAAHADRLWRDCLARQP
ncbi:MAG: dephospho-CoA kinase [Candidatus Krumholzibacteria bacterium]|jgi:dephospho-CoA kinase|nr:dephospho-CoA kinase [Candidatus Krumholzibacteria bacterium]